MTQNEFTRNMYRLANQVKHTFGDSKILVCPLAWNGAYDFGVYEKAMKDVQCQFPAYERRDIEKDRSQDPLDGEYRRIITPASDAKVPGIKYIVLFDDTIKSGKTMIGALVWALENKDELGFERAYIMASNDLLGMAHFSLLSHYNRWLGPADIMRNGAPEKGVLPFPETLKKLEGRGLLAAIGEMVMDVPGTDSRHEQAPTNGHTAFRDLIKKYKHYRGDSK